MLLSQFIILILIVVSSANLPMKIHHAVCCSSNVVTLRWWSLWVQARVSSGLAASAQTLGKATPPTSPASRHLSALLQRKVVVTNSRFASNTMSNCGSEVSPDTPPALDLMSPIRALGNRPRAVHRCSMALPSDAAPTAVGIPDLSPTVSFQRLLSSLSTPSPPRAISSSSRGSLLAAKVSGHTPTAPLAEPPVSVHGVVSVVDQGFSPGLSVPEAAISSTAFVPLQSTPMQQPLPAHGPSARSVAASNGRTRTVPSSAVSSGKASRRSSISNSNADRPAWSPCFSSSSVVHTCFAEDSTPNSRRLTTASPQRAASSPQPSPRPVRAIAGSPAVEPSSVQAMRHTGSNAAAARLMSTAKTGGSTRTAAQPGGVTLTAAQPNAGRAVVQGTSRAAKAAPTRAGPAAPAPAAHRLATIRATPRNSKAAASTPAGQSVAKPRQAASGRLGVVQSESVLAPAEPTQSRRGQDRTVKKKEAPARTQPARRAKNPGHTWKF